MTYLSIPETITIKRTSKIKPNSKTFSSYNTRYTICIEYRWFQFITDSFPVQPTRSTHKTNELSSQCIVIRNRITHNGLLRHSTVSKIYTNIPHTTSLPHHTAILIFLLFTHSLPKYEKELLYPLFMCLFVYA